MRCPACSTENTAEATQCGSCGRALARKPKRRAAGQQEAPSPFERPVDPVNWPCTRAYWVSCVSLIPGVGLIAGPLAFLLGVQGQVHASRQPACTTSSQAHAAILFGALSTLTNWGGLWLMILGWRASGS